MSDQPALNTDRELWRRVPGDFYSPRIFVTEGGGIGIDVGGTVFVKPIEGWHRLAVAAITPQPITLPCVSCGEQTEWLCADCRIDLRRKVAVCGKPECRISHEERNHDRPVATTEDV